MHSRDDILGTHRVRQKLCLERLSYLAPTLALRKEVQRVLAAVAEAGSEPAVRTMVDQINEKSRPRSGSCRRGRR